MDEKMESVSINEPKLPLNRKCQLITWRCKLHQALHTRDTAAIQTLISEEADVNVWKNEDYNGYPNPLHVAGDHGTVEIAQMLIDAGAKVDATEPDSGNTPLLYAAMHGNKEVLKLLISAGANINARNNWKQASALHLLQEDDSETLKVLVEAGIDINIKNKEEKTILHEAVDKKNISMVEFLLSLGADVNATDKYSKTALYDSVNQGNVAMIRLLLKYGADFDVQNFEDRNNPLLYALISDKIDVLQAFIDGDFDVNAEVSKANLTPFFTLCLCCKKNIDMMKLLLERGANINALDSQGCTPLMYVIMYPKGMYCSPTDKSSMKYVIKVLKFLIEFSDVNIVDARGRNVVNLYSTDKLFKIIAAHLAKLQILNLLNPSILQTIAEEKRYEKLFQKYTEELNLAKTTKLCNSWVSFFNLLVDKPRELKNYAGNEDLVKDFRRTNCLKKFPTYGATMIEKMKKGIESRKLYDESADSLSDCFMVFNPTHLVVRDILDCLDDEDLSRFCKKN